jgi:hypothetical protein
MDKEESKEQKASDYPEPQVGRGYTRVHVSTPRLVISNFLGGIAWGFGTVLGATVVVALLVFILSKLDAVPLLGDIVSNILENIQPTQ